MGTPTFTKTATVKYLNTERGKITLQTSTDTGASRYSSHEERCAALNNIDADLNNEGLQLVYEHRQQLGENVQTVRLYVETL